MGCLKEEFKKKFCKGILEYAVSKNLTAKDIAQEANISEQEASQILSYQYQDLTVDFIVLQYEKLVYNKQIIRCE